MAKQRQILQVFVASPGDVLDDRAVLEQVVREINTAWSGSLEVQFELLQWTTHASPGFGADAQDVINRQIPADYDLFVGIFWGRFGTPTQRAESGTEEEFEEALRRSRNGGGHPALMLYFKDEPISPSRIDAQQLSKVLDFKKRVSDKGGLYWTFTDSKDFESLTRLHLARFAHEWIKKIRGSAPPSPTVSAATADEGNVQPGILDLLASFDEHLNAAGRLAGRLQETLTEFSEHQKGHLAAAKRLQAAGDWNTRTMRGEADCLASDLDRFASRLAEEYPPFVSEFRQAFDDMAHAVTVLPDFGRAELRALPQTLKHVGENRVALAETAAVVQVFSEVIAATPRITTALNRARSRAGKILEDFGRELKGIQSTLAEVESSAARVLSDTDSSG
jgi:hypothetical protein